MIKQQKKNTRPKKHLDSQKEETKNLKPKKQSHLETQISINVFLNLTPSDEVNLASLTLKKFINLEAQACLNLRPKEAWAVNPPNFEPWLLCLLKPALSRKKNKHLRPSTLKHVTLLVWGSYGFAGSSFTVHTFAGLKLEMFRGWRSTYSSGLGHSFFLAVTTHKCLDCLAWALLFIDVFLFYLFGAASSFIIWCLGLKALASRHCDIFCAS